MLKHPLNKVGKKNRNIISGILVGLASLFLLVFYLDIDTSVLLRLFVAVLFFILGIIVLSICFLLILKGIRYLLFGNKKPGDNKLQDETNDPHSANELKKED